MFFAGIDIGSTITKVVIKNEEGILVSTAQPTGAEHRRLAHEVIKGALKKAGLTFDQIDFIVATGYGRINVPFADAQVSEITCHMRGVSWLFPGVSTVIDIGGQDCKGIKVAGGRMRNFIMNDKCAAGTGRFLEVISDTLGLKLEDIGEISLRSDNPAGVSKTCTIFAEQEVLLRLSEGVSVEDILAGLHKALAGRIHSMVSKIKIEKDVVITGGGAKNAGLCKYLEERIGFPVLIPSEPLITGALGASILAQEMAAKTSADEQVKKERKLEAVTFFDKED
ncbi:MAG: 2-hydroxyglutaryl-CoA dehydratase [Peptococcaceae bacterium BRH_c4b]|nr:MAG: 2-hydroxyglutaryl-CoA dehydratase [Peptococcaceae bacterium BRH_c4b]